MILVLSLGCTEKEPTVADETKTSAPKNQVKTTVPDPQKIVGRWLRPDGGYILELGDVQDGGVLRAAYFNPSPIDVCESKWGVEGSELSVFVKFDHPHYPGSYYHLIYDPDQDRLRGAYYQAVQDRTYNVEFVRHE